MKDAYWMPHDSNSKDDPKCMLLIEDLGLEGYGAFWVLIEYLRDQPDYKCLLSMLRVLARKYKTTESVMNDVVNKYNLFVIDDESFFFSESLIRRMVPLESKREKARLAGKASAEKRAKEKYLFNRCSTDVQQTFNECSTGVQPVQYNIVEENRVENKKKNIIFMPPTLDEVKAYIKENNLNVTPGSFFEYYSGSQWIDKNGKSVKNWKLKAQTWSKQADNKGEHNRVEASNGIDIGAGEFIVDGKRCYGDRNHPVQIPDGMSPRPSLQYCLDRENLKWVIL